MSGIGTSIRAYRVRVRGRVQRVGYRRYLLDLAQDLVLTGYVGNERDGSVTAFVQGEVDALKDFLEAIREPHLGVVREVVLEEAEPKPDLDFFEIKFGSLAEELQEGFGAMEMEFRDYRDEFRDYRTEFKGFADRTDKNFEDLSSRYGEISEKLSLTLETLRAESAETRRMLAEAIESLKRDSAETRAELKRAVDNLVRLVEKFIERF